MLGGHLELTKRHGGGAIDVQVLKRKSWPGVTAQYVQIAAPTTFNFHVSADASYIALHNLYRADGETSTSVAGMPRSFLKDLRNKLTYSPCGSDLEGWCKIDKLGTIAAVMIQPSAHLSHPIDLAQLPARVEFEDEMLRSLLLRFQAILDDPSLDIPGYAETLAELLAFELNRVVAGPQNTQVPVGGLTEYQLRLVTDYMNDRLTQKIAMAELAALLDMSRFHFIRSFKQATGTPPHQFVIRRRAERARELLSDTQTSVAEAAERTGFGSAYQLTRAFRRVFGTTPAAARRHRGRRRSR